MNPDLLMHMMDRMGITPSDMLSMQHQMGLGSVPPPRRQRPPPAFNMDLSPAHLQERIAEYKVWLEEERQLGPEPAPYIPREMLVSGFLASRAQFEKQLRSDESTIRQTIVGFPKCSSTTPIDQLKPITVSKMLVRKTHVGYYLLCRFVTPCSRIAAVQVAAEDSEGTVFSLSIYNFPTLFDCSAEYLDALFPAGTIIAIREPTYKAATQGIYPIVRVDSPTDILLVTPGSKMFGIIQWSTGARVPGAPSFPNTVDGWKARGNTFFKAGQWLPAALAYSHGIALDRSATVLFLNRSEAYLRLKFYSGALADLQHVLASADISDAFRDKALSRGGKAQYGREKYHEAIEMFRLGSIRDEETMRWITRCEARIAEGRSGVYDWVELFRSSLNNPHLDVADYRGPIKVREIQGRGGGRGVVATKNIKVGDLLIVSKPFVSAYDQDLRPRELMLVTDLLTSRITKQTSCANTLYAAQKLCGNPELHALVFDLYAGPNYPSPPSSYPPAVLHNPSPVDLLLPALDIDIARLEAICSRNSFAPVPLKPIGEPLNESSRQGLDTPSGLYLLPSLFNHACSANAAWRCIGDIMIIRATQPIKAGDEIFIPYTNEFNYEARTQNLRGYLPTACDCWLCKEDRKDTAAARACREQLLQESLKSRLRQMSLARLRSLEAQLCATYSPSRGKVRPLLAQIKDKIAIKLFSQGEIKEGLEECREALESLGFVLRDRTPRGRDSTLSSTLPISTDRLPLGITSYYESLTIIFGIAQTFLKLGREAHATKWLKAAEWVLNCVFGGDKSFFLAVMQPALLATGLEEFAKRVL